MRVTKAPTTRTAIPDSGLTDACSVLSDFCDSTANDNHTTRYGVTLDNRGFTQKPKGAQVAGITRRMQGRGPEEVTLAQLVSAIASGVTWCGGTFEPSKAGWGQFIGQRLFGLDFDNKVEVLDPMDALGRCVTEGIDVLLWYPTFSATVEPWRPRFRIVIDAGVTLDDATARDFDVFLKGTFPEADRTFNRAHNRLLFGTRWAVQPMEMVA